MNYTNTTFVDFNLSFYSMPQYVADPKAIDWCQEMVKNAVYNYSYSYLGFIAFIVVGFCLRMLLANLIPFLKIDSEMKMMLYKVCDFIEAFCIVLLIGVLYINVKRFI